MVRDHFYPVNSDTKPELRTYCCGCAEEVPLRTVSECRVGAGNFPLCQRCVRSIVCDSCHQPGPVGLAYIGKDDCVTCPACIRRFLAAGKPIPHDWQAGDYIRGLGEEPIHCEAFERAEAMCGEERCIGIVVQGEYIEDAGEPLTVVLCGEVA